MRAGDDVAFEALYDAYHAKLLTFCRHMLGSREEAEDAVQHTFLAAYRCLRAGHEITALKPWLYTVARNRCLSVVRARREEIALEESAPATEGLAAEVDRRADLRMLVRDVQRLPPDQRAALVLFEVGDHSHQDIAAVLGVRREKVKALVFQARAGAHGLADRARDAVRPRARAARDAERRRAGTRHVAPPCRAVRGLCGLRGRGAPPARGSGDRAAGAPAAGLRAAVLGSALGGSGVGAVAGVGVDDGRPRAASRPRSSWWPRSWAAPARPAMWPAASHRRAAGPPSAAGAAAHPRRFPGARGHPRKRGPLRHDGPARSDETEGEDEGEDEGEARLAVTATPRARRPTTIHGDPPPPASSGARPPRQAG